MAFKTNKSKKEGQMIGQAFIFILAAILFSLILLFGYRAISRIGETQTEVEMVEFKDSLSGAINKIRLDYGSVKKFPLKIPNVFKEVCFIDLESMKDPVKFDGLKGKSPLIADAVESGAFDPKEDQNVFTKPPAKTPIKVGAIDAGEKGYICFENKGAMINLRLEGMGDKAGITAWPE